jgi:hypothetical protein
VVIPEESTNLKDANNRQARLRSQQGWPALHSP